MLYFVFGIHSTSTSFSTSRSPIFLAVDSRFLSLATALLRNRPEQKRSGEAPYRCARPQSPAPESLRLTTNKAADQPNPLSSLQQTHQSTPPVFRRTQYSPGMLPPSPFGSAKQPIGPPGRHQPRTAWSGGCLSATRRPTDGAQTKKSQLQTSCHALGDCCVGWLAPARGVCGVLAYPRYH
ncbi:hypothetical protein BKA80DRAFT_122826 [Phyllosticta citrichinensis]